MSIVQHRPLTKVLNKYFDRIPAPYTFLINFVFVMHRKSSWIIPPFFIWYPAGYRILLPYSQPNTGYQKRPDISFLTLVRKSFTIGNENTQFFITKDKKSPPQNFRNECKKIICNFFDKFFFVNLKIRISGTVPVPVCGTLGSSVSGFLIRWIFDTSLLMNIDEVWEKILKNYIEQELFFIWFE